MVCALGLESESRAKQPASSLVFKLMLFKNSQTIHSTVVKVITISFTKAFITTTDFAKGFAICFVVDFTTNFVANSYFNYLIGIEVSFVSIGAVGVLNICPLSWLIIGLVAMVIPVIFIIEAVYWLQTITIILITYWTIISSSISTIFTRATMVFMVILAC